MRYFDLKKILFLLIIVAMSCSNGRKNTEQYSLFELPSGYSPVEIGQLVCNNFLARDYMLSEEDPTIHYAEACTWFGALQFASNIKNKELQKALISRFSPLLKPENAHLIPKREAVDWTVWGIVPLEIFIQTGDSIFLPLGKEKADRQYENADEYGHSRQTRFWIDDMFMISAIQTQAYRATGDTIYLERAANEMVFYLDSLQQSNGLFFHSSKGAKGRYHWGRGNGWMAAGMAILLKYLPKSNTNYDRIMQSYNAMMEGLLKYQDKNGLWHQLIDYPESWAETSGTAMFTYAMIVGIKNGWLPSEKYIPVARKAWMSLVDSIDSDGNLHNICKGMGIKASADAYLQAQKVNGDLHGQAPVLWCAAELIN